MNRERERQAAQLAFAAGGAEIEVGSTEGSGLSVKALSEIDGSEQFVVQAFDAGLTARVLRLRVGNRDWTLKRARAQSLVQTVDGQSSFLNEVQRRRDFASLKGPPGGARRFAAIVDTQYASYRRGILLSPWIEGETVSIWDERRLRQFFDQLVELLLAGFFEWDFCPGNILDDGDQVRLFDFGYMYRFDPLTEFNSSGLDAPLFHGAERLETRNYFAWLMELEKTAGEGFALAAFRLEKQIALGAYEHLISELEKHAATATVVGNLRSIVTRWRKALGGDLAALYLAEGWRSHRLELGSDLHGQTCTPTSLAHADWMLCALTERFADLQALDAFFWDDLGRSQEALKARVRADRELAVGWQSTSQRRDTP